MKKILIAISILASTIGASIGQDNNCDWLKTAIIKSIEQLAIPGNYR